MWFPHICKTAVVKKTGRAVKIRSIFNDHVVFVEGSFFRRTTYRLSELQLDWSDVIPVDQRCNSTVFQNLVKSADQ
jgi:hypothetical protein